MNARTCAGCEERPDCERLIRKPPRGPWAERCSDCTVDHNRAVDRERQRAKRRHHCPARGWCYTCRKYNLKPRPEWEVGRSRPERLRKLRTRIAEDPKPEFAPRWQDFEREDGTELYADARKLTLAEREWLDRVAPDPNYIKRPHFERAHSLGWQPACRSGLTGTPERDLDPENIDHCPGPLDADIYGFATREYDAQGRKRQVVGGDDDDLSTGTGATPPSRSIGEKREWFGQALCGRCEPPEGLLRWRERQRVEVVELPRDDDELELAA